ncbi:MAG: hypothetical protein A2W01_00055 [Candidatus Solincola sediminis]|nr:MAG: hypothetical protein A2W01_00055 [Candidatus Solincola sediminis]
MIDGQKGMLHNIAPKPIAILLVLLVAAPLFLFGPLNTKSAQAGGLSGWKFCVDAGHDGYNDTGAKGPTGLKEEDINLQVALKLKAMLEAEGAQVLMTRTDNGPLTIAQRYTMANDWGADRFISIHHNAMSGQPSVNGTETLIATNASQEAKELANSVQAALVGELGLPNRGIVPRSDVSVLTKTNMPAILTEASFLSNPQEEQRLRDDGYLCREASAIMRGIHMPSSVSFILPQENVISYQAVDVSLQVLGSETVSNVQLLMNDTFVQSKSAEPYNFSVDTGGLADGSYNLRALVTYQGGRQASINRDMIIANQAKRWYFAEGTTRPEFQEWLTILNPNTQPVDFTVTYAFEGSDVMKRNYHVESESRLSIEVTSEVGVGRDVSVLVDSPLPIMVERPMYFLYRGQWDGGHVSSGSNQPKADWYFAEGTTRQGFEEWLCMLNPGDQAARVKVEYLTAGGLLSSEEITVEPWRRSTIFVNEKVGPDQDVSLRVTSDKPIVAERPMYFYFEGRLKGGSVSTGANQAAADWYFAEGYTGTGFREFICLFNPATTSTKARLNFQIQGAGPQAHEVEIPALSRFTFDVNTRIGNNLQLSVAVNSDSPIVAERPIYYNYHNWCRGGDVGIGVTEPSRHWYFAEGYTGEGFEDWLCLQNPGNQAVDVEIRFHMESNEVMWERHTLTANSRTTFSINYMNPYQEGMGFSIHSSGDIIVERPIYFRYKGAWVGGTVSPGYGPGTKD